jgi:hypothetical protein
MTTKNAATMTTTQTEQYPEVSLWKLAAAPFMGLAFIVLLPIIGIAMILRAAFHPAVELASGTAEGLAANLGQTWQPGEAHLTGKSDEHAEAEPQGPPAKNDKVEALQSEIEQKRQGR